MKKGTKVRILAERIEDEYLEVEHLYRVLQTNIEPKAHTTEAAYKVQAMKLLKTAMDALDEATSYVRGL